MGKTTLETQEPHSCPPGAQSGFLQTKVRELPGGTLLAPREGELTQPKPSPNSVEAVRLFVIQVRWDPRAPAVQGTGALGQLRDIHCSRPPPPPAPRAFAHDAQRAASHGVARAR